MYKKTDLNSFVKTIPLLSGTDTIGALDTTFTVHRHDDVLVQDTRQVIKPKTIEFILQCSQRIKIWNPNASDLSPIKDLTSYTNYPALVVLGFDFIDVADGVTFELLDYSPKTVNTKIQASGTTGSESGSVQGTSSSSTVGSSTAQTNSFGTSVSVGGGPEGMTGSVSANYEHSKTNTHDHSNTHGLNASQNKGENASQSASMSIKDWGAYSFVNPTEEVSAPKWIFGQEYPWDAIEFRRTDGTLKNNQTKISVPAGVLSRLYDGTLLCPPSQLSMFGVNFVMMASWKVIVPIANTNTYDKFNVNQIIDYFSASHSIDSSKNPSSVDVYFDSTPAELSTNSKDGSISTELGLLIMSLTAIYSNGGNAVVGFIPNKFIVPPAVGTTDQATVPFKIASASNNLAIFDTTRYTGNTVAGFSASQEGMSTTFSSQCLALKMTAYFKIAEYLDEYTLFIKHWRTGESNIKLSIIFNGDQDNIITRHVDSLEAEGGENNLLAITLRNQDYSSIDFHDYLQLGLNSVQIIIEPEDSTKFATSGYHIRAFSIEKT